MINFSFSEQIYEVQGALVDICRDYRGHVGGAGVEPLRGVGGGGDDIGCVGSVRGDDIYRGVEDDRGAVDIFVDYRGDYEFDDERGIVADRLEGAIVLPDDDIGGGDFGIGVCAFDQAGDVGESSGDP